MKVLCRAWYCAVLGHTTANYTHSYVSIDRSYLDRAHWCIGRCVTVACTFGQKFTLYYFDSSRDTVSVYPEACYVSLWYNFTNRTHPVRHVNGSNQINRCALRAFSMCTRPSCPITAFGGCSLEAIAQMLHANHLFIIDFQIQHTSANINLDPRSKSYKSMFSRN